MSTLTLAYLLFAAGLALLVWKISKAATRHQNQVTSFLQGDTEDPLLDIYHMTGGALCKHMPETTAGLRQKDLSLLERAGLYPRWSPEDIIGMQMIWGIVCGLLGVYVLGWPLLWRIAVPLAIGLYLPRWWIHKKRKERQLQITHDFPTAIDMITLGLEGGLDFTAGLKETVENSDPSPVRQEFQRVIYEISMGAPRVETMRKFMKRVDAVEIKTVLTGMIQALELGVGLAETLSIQAEQLRYSRLMRAEEEAQKVPTKMLLPMFLFIFPCILIIIFVPMAMSMAQQFSQSGL